MAGSSCTTCTDGRVLSASFSCTECPDTWLVVLLVLFAAGLGLVALAYFVQDARKEEAATSLTVLVKIAVSFFQFNAMGLSFQFDWTESVTSLLSTHDAVTSFGTAYFELACLTGTQSFLAETLVFAIGPLLVVGAAAMLLYALGRPELAIGKTVAMVVCYLLQPTLAQRAMLVFSCVRLGAGPEQFYLTSDLDVRCWSDEHMTLVLLLGVPMLLVYVCGIPLLLLLLLRRNQRWIKDATGPDPQGAVFRQNYSFLWQGYQLTGSARYLWEVVVVCRKSGLLMIAVFFAFNVHAQALFGFVAVVAALLLHARVFPFAKRYWNYLELLSLICTVHLFVCSFGAFLPFSLFVCVLIQLLMLTI